MKKFFKRTKKKAKEVVDSLRPSSRQGRSESPASHASAQSTPNINTEAPPTPPLQLQPGATALLSSPVQSGTSTPLLGLDKEKPATVSSSPADATTAHAPPSAPTSAPTAVVSEIHHLLTAIRDASDMCLPLKAAVVSMLKIWDVCEVSSLVLRLHTELIRPL